MNRPKRPKFSYCFLVLAVVLSFSTGLFAQLDQGAVTGTVTDPQGRAVPNAVVKLVNLGTNFQMQQRTNSSGVYVFEPVNIGHYKLTVSAPGFATASRTGLEVNVDQRLNLNVTLKVGKQLQTVEVHGKGTLLQSQQASTGQVMPSKMINDLPLSGRNYVFVAQLAAGVHASNGSRGQGNGDFNANGQRSTQNDFILDGIDNNSAAIDFLNGASYVVKPPPDAIAEFKVQTGDYSAQFGHSAGAVLNVSIKSGTNRLHGDVWEYLRNTSLDARDWNALTIPPYHQNQFGATIGGPIKKNKLFFFGDYSGNRISFSHTATTTVPTALMRQGDFSELLNTKLTGNPVPVKLYEPGTGGVTPMSCNGAPNVLCQSQIVPLAQKLLDMYPMPNANGGKTYNNYVKQLNDTDNVNHFDIRVDYNLSSKDQMFGRVSYSHENAGRQPILGSVLDGGGTFNVGTFINYGKNFEYSETHEFSPTFVNQFRYGYNWGYFNWLQPLSGTNVAAKLGLGGIPSGPLLGGLPNVYIGGINNFGNPLFQPSPEHENVYQFIDAATKILGNHTLKFGFNLENERYSVFQPTFGLGAYAYTGEFTGAPGVSFTGSGVADYLAGYMATANLSNADQTNMRRWFYGAYFQDDWKATPRLTLNLGLRYDFFQPPEEHSDHQALFYFTGPHIPGQGSGVYALPNSQKNVPLSSLFTNLLSANNIKLKYSNLRSLIKSQKTNFAPRVGIAYQLTPKLVIRSGFGMFYGGLENLGNYPNLGVNYPYDIEQFFPSGSCQPNNCQPNGLTLATGFPSGGLTTPSLRGAQPQWQTPYSIQYNLTTQYALSNNTTLSLGYVGNVGRHLQTVVFANGSDALIAPGLSTIPYQDFPGFGSIGYIVDTGISSFNSLQATLRRHFSNGLSFLATYTYSHSLDNSREPLPSNNDGQGQKAWSIVGLGPEYSNSPFDTRHRFTLAATYDLPFGAGRRFMNRKGIANVLAGGWAVTPLLTAETGQPFTVFSDIATVNGAGAYPMLVGNPAAAGGTPNPTNPGISCPSQVRTTANWYNPCAFQNPPPATAIKSGQVVTGKSVLAYLGGPREQIYNAGFARLNLTVFKNFKTFESQYLQFRADIFNVTNTPSWGPPSNTGITRTGGEITGPRFFANYQPDARFFQLALKYYF